MKTEPCFRVLSGTGAFALLAALSVLPSGSVIAEERPRGFVVESAPLPPPTVVEETPPRDESFVAENEAPAQEVMVQEAPPPLREEFVIERPSPHHVWISGYWHWAGHRYVWVRGHWVRPPRAGVVWVAPHFEHRHGGNVFIAGFWRHGGINVGVAVPSPVVEEAAPPSYETVVVENEALSQEIIVQGAPPPPREEFVIERPSPHHVWISGYWHWAGHRYVWVRGHWVRPPRAGVVWVAPHFEHRPGGSVFIGGFWRHGGVAVEVDRRHPLPGPHVVILREAPPALRREEIPRHRPSPVHIWIAGFWRHDGHRYFWVPGHWDKPPHHGAVWINPRWEIREGNWVFIEGRWESRH
jgi:hypothetical protein